MTAFDALHTPVQPADPDRRLVERLRADLTAALTTAVTLPDRSLDAIGDTEPAGPRPRLVTRLVPYLAVRGAAAAIDWYTTVFGARETVRYTGDDALIGHAELDIAGVTLYLSDEYPDFDAVSPSSLGGSTVALNLVVDDVDAVFERAVARGAIVRREPADQPYGERSCTFLDPWGHRWMVQTTIATPTVAEINATMEGFTVTENEYPPDQEPRA